MVDFNANYNPYASNYNLNTNSGNVNSNPYYNLSSIGVQTPINPQVHDTYTTSFTRRTRPVKKDASNDGKFSLGEAFKNLFKGAFSFVKGIVQHPIKSIAIAAGIGVASIFCPAVPLVLAGWGLCNGLFSIGSGIFKAVTAGVQGDGDGVEKAFYDIGQGGSTIALTAISARALSGKATTKFSFTKEGFKNWFSETKEAVRTVGKGAEGRVFNFAKSNIKAGWKTLRHRFSKDFKPGESLKDFFKSEKTKAVEGYAAKRLTKFNDKTLESLSKKLSKDGIEVKGKLDIDQLRQIAKNNPNNKAIKKVIEDYDFNIEIRGRKEIEDLDLFSKLPNLKPGKLISDAKNNTGITLDSVKGSLDDGAPKNMDYSI